MEQRTSEVQESNQDLGSILQRHTMVQLLLHLGIDVNLGCAVMRMLNLGLRSGMHAVLRLFLLH